MNGDVITITPAAYDALVAHAREAAPNECCGLLIGTGDTISVAVRARNLEESPTRFQVDPLDHFTAIRLARMRGQAVVGVYHSHPARDAAPSPSDVREASYREYVYLIVSLADQSPSVNAYRLRDDAFVEIEMTVA